MVRDYRYLLGDSPVEAARLRAQARLWDPVACALFDRLRVRPGWKVLEIGPGQGSLHMELRRRLRGPLDAVERSGAFAARLGELCAKDGLGAGRIWNQDLWDAPLPRAHYDLIFARWVFLFLPKPEEHLRKLARALKPGGTIALMDYHRETFGLVPRPPQWGDFLAADRAFFASQGGHASIGRLLPGLYRRVGLKVVEVSPEIKTGHPGSPQWDWMMTYLLGILDRYAALPPFSLAKARGLRKELLAAARRKDSLFIAPTVLSVVGRKTP